MLAETGTKLEVLDLPNNSPELNPRSAQRGSEAERDLERPVRAEFGLTRRAVTNLAQHTKEAKAIKAKLLIGCDLRSADDGRYEELSGSSHLRAN
jgi:hypothetical protein